MKQLLILIIFFFSSNVFAVRPFVTDDARIVDVRQLEIETWTEFARSSTEMTLGQHIMTGYSFNDWFELIGGFGKGKDLKNGEFTIGNPVIQPKFLLWQAYRDGFPGLAIGLGATLPYGRGAFHDEAFGAYAVGMMTSRLFHDRLQLHFNFGKTFAKEKGQATGGRNYWGIGIDVGVYKIDHRYILEAYAGDPFEALGPNLSFQTGFRWLKSDFLNFDFTIGTQPELTETRTRSGKWEYWGQVGVRLLFDELRGKLGPSRYEGAKGALNPLGKISLLSLNQNFQRPKSRSDFELG
jgi:hypothetical protein